MTRLAEITDGEARRIRRIESAKSLNYFPSIVRNAYSLDRAVVLALIHKYDASRSFPPIVIESAGLSDESFPASAKKLNTQVGRYFAEARGDRTFQEFELPTNRQLKRRETGGLDVAALLDQAGKLDYIVKVDFPLLGAEFLNKVGSDLILARDVRSHIEIAEAMTKSLSKPVSLSTIRDIEAGEHPLRLEELASYAQAANHPVVIKLRKLDSVRHGGERIYKTRPITPSTDTLTAPEDMQESVRDLFIAVRNDIRASGQRKLLEKHNSDAQLKRHLGALSLYASELGYEMDVELCGYKPASRVELNSEFKERTEYLEWTLGFGKLDATWNTASMQRLLYAAKQKDADMENYIYAKG